MSNNPNRANEYRSILADLYNNHIGLARLNTPGLEADEIMIIRDLIARAERRAIAKAKGTKP